MLADGKIIPVQVTWEAPLERHQRAAEAFYERFPQAEEMVFVTMASFESALSRLL